jgi:nucleotide-binding universal stress UspA family protein
MKTGILLATDGTASAAGAVRIAARISETSGLDLHVIGVAEPPTILSYGPESVMATPDVQAFDLGREEMERRVRDQLRTLAPDVPPATLEIVVGTPPQAIVRRAEKLGVAMIVLGKGRHHLVDRLFGSETALRVAHLSHTPLLAVEAEADALPARALVGVDFSGPSMDAVKAVVPVLRSGGELVLAHVIWSPPSTESGAPVSEWSHTYAVGARERLSEIARQETAGRPLESRTLVLWGDPATSLVKAAEKEDAELLVVGSYGHGFIGRAILGSVASQMLRHAYGSVLVTPPTGEDRTPVLVGTAATEITRYGNRVLPAAEPSF